MAEDVEREKHIQARAEAGEYHCREHWIFDADADVLFLCAALAQARKNADAAIESAHVIGIDRAEIRYALEQARLEIERLADEEHAGPDMVRAIERAQRERDALVCDALAGDAIVFTVPPCGTTPSDYYRAGLRAGAAAIRAQSEG